SLMIHVSSGSPRYGLSSSGVRIGTLRYPANVDMILRSVRVASPTTAGIRTRGPGSIATQHEALLQRRIGADSPTVGTMTRPVPAPSVRTVSHGAGSERPAA